MTDIFFSYAKEDRDRIAPIVRLLLDKGWSVWWDRKITVGKTFDDEIEKALSGASCVLVAWSKNSINSRWVKTEAAEGAERGVLVPIVIDDVKVPFEFRRIQAAQMENWNGKASSETVKDLLAAITAVLANRAQSPTTETPARALETSTWLKVDVNRSRRIKQMCVGLAILLAVMAVMSLIIFGGIFKQSSNSNTNNISASPTMPKESPVDSPARGSTPTSSPKPRPTASTPIPSPQMTPAPGSVWLENYENRDVLCLGGDMRVGLTFHGASAFPSFSVTGGTVHPNGLNAIWDLSGVRPGRYTATGKDYVYDSQTRSAAQVARSLTVTVRACR